MVTNDPERDKKEFIGEPDFSSHMQRKTKTAKIICRPLTFSNVRTIHNIFQSSLKKCPNERYGLRRGHSWYSGAAAKNELC